MGGQTLLEPAEAKNMETLMATFAAGDRVCFTGKYLKSTGQLVGGEWQSAFTVVTCPCDLCATEYVAIAEQESFYGGPRHIHAGNLQLTIVNCA